MIISTWHPSKVSACKFFAPLSPILQEAFPCFLACSKCSQEDGRHLTSLNPFPLPALLCINYDLSLGISKCYSASSPGDKGLKQRKNLQNSIYEKLILESVKTYFIFMTNWLTFMASHVVNVGNPAPVLCSLAS